MSRRLVLWIQSVNHAGGRPQGGLRIESVVDPQNDSWSESNSHSDNDLMAESATESADELENQPPGESKSDSADHSQIDLRGESASDLLDDSAGESQNDSWNDLPNATALDGSVSVEHALSRSCSSAA
jgi:hypothetical protein